MTHDPFHSARPDGDQGWLMYHSVGRFPGQSEAAGTILSQAARDWYDNGDQHWFPGLAQRARAIELFSDLIVAPPESVFTAENVTLAFATFMMSLPPETFRGRKILIAGDCFPSLHFLLAGLAPRLEFELHTVPLPPSEHYVTDDAFLEAWNEETALAVITWITSTASKRADLGRMLTHGRRMGSLVAVDITQGAGLVPFESTEFDFAASTSLKWLCGMTGAGFGYASPRLLSSLEPSLRGWFSQNPPLNWDLDKFAFAVDARRFGNGTPSLLPYIASLPGIEWVHGQTSGDLLRRNQVQCQRLFAIADANDLNVITPRDPEARGGSVIVALGTEEEAEAMRQGLVGEGLFCDRRGVRVRWSPGPVTTDAALDHLAVVLPRLCADLRLRVAEGA